MPIESSISAPESGAEACAKQRDRNDFGPDRILYIGARRLWEQGPKSIQHLGLQQDRVLYIGAGLLRKLVAISASGAVPLNERAIPAPVLAEVTRMGFQPLLRLHVPAGKVPGVTLEPRGLVGLLPCGLALGLRAGNLPKLQPRARDEEGLTEAATSAARRSSGHRSLGWVWRNQP